MNSIKKLYNVQRTAKSIRKSFRKSGLIVKENTCTLVHTESLACLVRNWYRCVMFDGSLASKLAEGIWDSSIYESGVAIIRRPTKSGAKRDDVGPIPAKVRIDIWEKGKKTGHRNIRNPFVFTIELLPKVLLPSL